jgi:3-oxoacyl-[acyl-carrier-protein] synthase II
VIEDGAAGANPGVFPNTVYNAAGGQVAIKVGILGPATTVCVGHAAGAASLVYAYDLVSANRADAIVSVGADTLTDTVIDAYKGLGVLGSGGDGDGFALAEAGVALVLERASNAKARGAKVYGEVLGYGITSDATGVGHIDPEGEGIERAMRLALESSGVDAGDIKAVWSSETGLKVSDEAEQKAIERVFGSDVKVLSPKKELGEPMGAGGSLEAALAMTGWDKGDDSSPRGPVLVNSLSLGGTNYSIVIAPAE